MPDYTSEMGEYAPLYIILEFVGRHRSNDVMGECVAYCVENNVVKIINVVPYGLFLRDIRIRNCFPNAFSSI